MDDDSARGDEASDAGTGDPDEPQVRGASSLLLRGLLGLTVGAAAGAVGFRLAGMPAPEGAALGGALGLVVWGAVGVFLWATFPYKSPG